MEEQDYFTRNRLPGHGIWVSQTMRWNRTDVQEFQGWLSKFADSSDEDLQQALEEKYGYPFFSLTGQGNSWTMYLGSPSESH
jgi:hypothetical protein